MLVTPQTETLSDAAYFRITKCRFKKEIVCDNTFGNGSLNEAHIYTKSQSTAYRWH
jgi:hypothetical protein